MFDTLVAIGIILSILGLSFSMIYWGFKQVYKSLKPATNREDILMREIYSLKEHVEALERKVSNR